MFTEPRLCLSVPPFCYQDIHDIETYRKLKQIEADGLQINN